MHSIALLVAFVKAIDEYKHYRHYTVLKEEHAVNLLHAFVRADLDANECPNPIRHALDAHGDWSRTHPEGREEIAHVEALKTSAAVRFAEAVFAAAYPYELTAQTDEDIRPVPPVPLHEPSSPAKPGPTEPF